MIDLTEYRWWRVEPVDAWFFRDGRPSNRGEQQSDLDSEFPPNPPTVVGALRAALARANGWSGRGSWADESSELKTILGDGFEDLGQLRFLGPFLLERDSATGTEELLWPMPRHVVGRLIEMETGQGDSVARFKATHLLTPGDAILCDAGHIRLPALPQQHHEKPAGPADDFFVTAGGFSKILAGQCPDPAETRHHSELFAREPRVGIWRQADTRTTGSNALYAPRYVRLKQQVALVEAVSGLPSDWTLPSLMPLGGESRMAAVEPIDQPQLPRGASAGPALAISLAPTCFDDPWWGAGPGDDASHLCEKLSGRILTVALDRPLRIGGWDSLAGAPLPLRPLVPPGTVWWVERPPSVGGLSLIGHNTRYGYGLIVLKGASA